MYITHISHAHCSTVLSSDGCLAIQNKALIREELVHWGEGNSPNVIWHSNSQDGLSWLISTYSWSEHFIPCYYSNLIISIIHSFDIFTSSYIQFFLYWVNYSDEVIHIRQDWWILKHSCLKPCINCSYIYSFTEKHGKQATILPKKKEQYLIHCVWHKIIKH